MFNPEPEGDKHVLIAHHLQPVKAPAKTSERGSQPFFNEIEASRANEGDKRGATRLKTRVMIPAPGEVCSQVSFVVSDEEELGVW